MKRLYPLSYFVPLLAASAAHGNDEHQLTSSAHAATVEIAPLPERRSVSLPELEFPFRINANCAGDEFATSISISIADTVTSHDISTENDQSLERPADPVLLETILKVPGQQLAPVMIEEFCTGDTAHDSGGQSLLVRGAIAANISLRCSGDASQSIRYARLPLEIRLICKQPDPETSNSP
jgi:hypothetical protein